MVGKAAEMLMKETEKETFANLAKSYLLGSCVELLIKYLRIGEKNLLRTGNKSSCSTCSETVAPFP